MNERKFLPLNLQFFADGSEETPPVENEGGEETKTFTQDDLDKIVAERIARERKKLEKFADYDELKSKLSEYEKSEKERKEAEMSELERYQAQLAEKDETAQSLQQKLEELQEQMQREKVVNAFIKAAPSVNIPADRIDAALKLADLSAVKVGEEGIEGLDEVLNTLVEQYAFLAETKKPQKQIGEGSNFGKDESQEKTGEQLLKEAEEKARKTGRTEDRAAYAKLKRELGL